MARRPSIRSSAATRATRTFRHIVDRYLADFERMLQDASKADPKGRTVQTHLTSETGRIYLVLGHASGRLVV